MPISYCIRSLFHYLVLIALLVVPNTSCSSKKNKANNVAEQAIINTKTNGNISKPPFLITVLGDTLLTGVPVSINGKSINPDDRDKPKAIPVRNQPIVEEVQTNVHVIGTPKVVFLSKKQIVVTPGKGHIPLPKIVPAKGKVVPCKHPPPIPAKLPQIKDLAIGNIQCLSQDQGMNASQVNAILEDSRGNLWFGTFEGVSKYDGSYFTHYTTEEGLSHNTVLSILEDDEGNLWFGTDGGGVNCFDGKNFTHYTKEEGLGHNDIKTMLKDSKGDLWFGTFGGVSQYDGENFIHYTRKVGLISGFVWSMMEDRKGDLWFGTGGGVCRWNGNNLPAGEASFTHFTTENGLSHNTVYSLLEDKQGNIWFGTGGGGLNRYDGKSFTHFTTEEGLSYNSILSMAEDKQGNLWFGTWSGGVNCYDGNSFIHYTTKEGLSHNWVGSILEDSQNKLWFGTSSGVCCFDNNSFTHFNMGENLGGNSVNSLLEDSRGNLWIGTYDGVRRFDPAKDGKGGHLTHFTKENGLSSNNIYSMLEDSKGKLWFGTWKGGVSCYDGNSFIQYTTKEGLNHNWVYSILEDSKGDLWFGTSGGVSHFDGSNFTHFTIREGFSNHKVWSILEDSQGKLWFGTSAGVSRFDGNNFIHFTTNEGLAANRVSSILEDSKGKLWFGTSGGLSCYDGNSFTSYTTKDGLSHNNVVSILEDTKNNIWISTRNGITLLTPHFDESPSSENLKTGGYKFFNFGKPDGLKTVDFELNSVCLSQENQIWWGARNGLTMLDLNQFTLPTTSPKIKLNEISIENQFIDFRRLTDSSYVHNLSFGKTLSHSFDSVSDFNNYPINLSLPYELNHLTFHFSGIDWAAPHKLKYSYFLEGLEETWSALKSENQVDYRNIPYGTFTFKVKTIGAAQIWSQPFEYTFKIRPPWYRTTLAYALWICLTIGGIYSLYSFQLKRRFTEAEAVRLKELNQLKSRLYTNITHEFRTPLTIILGMAEQVKSDPENWFNEGLGLIRRNGKQLLNLVNQMLDLSKLESGNLQLKPINGNIVSFLQYLLESFHSYADSKDIRLHFASDFKEFQMDYDPEKMQNVISNLLSNGIKFTPSGGDIYLDIRVIPNEEKNILIQIRDNGIGIAPEHLPHIFDRFYQADSTTTRQGDGTGIGLALTKELVKLMGGEIEVESEIEKGTKFSIHLLVTQDAEKTNGRTEENVPTQIGATILLEKELTVVDLEVASQKNPLVLLVEDNLDVITYLRSFLSGEYQIVTATNGQQGIDKAIELIPDLIVSDVMMPMKDGFELCATLKKDERTSHIPIILLTAKSDQLAKIEGLAHGADAYLAKPFNKDELLIRIEKLIELRKQMSQHFQHSSLLEVVEKKQPTPEELFLQKLIQIVDKNLSDEHFGLPELCKKAGLSRSQLFRKLKALTGKSTTKFIRSFRLEKGKKLLETTDLTIAEIAFQVGFSNPNYFTRTFQETYGVSPSSYRNQ